MSRAILSAALVVFAAAAFGQPAFEVASIKPNHSDDSHSSSHSNGSEIIMRNVSLRSCIERAYDLKEYSLIGPDWLRDARFDISAKAPSRVKGEEMRLMMQTLLADRFKMVAHRESKMLGAYALVIAKNGPKIHPAEPRDSSGTDSNDTQMTGKRITMAQLADFLARRLDRPVVDKTGLAGVFDLKLEWAPDTDTTTTAGPSIFAALEEQIGLKLQPQKLPVEILVIDHIERVPTEN